MAHDYASLEGESNTFDEQSFLCETKAMRTTARVKELEAQLAALRKMARTQREPISSVGGSIQAMREQRGITLSQLAEDAGVPKGTVSRVETGSNFEFGTFCSLAFAFGLTPAAFLQWHEAERGCSYISHPERTPKPKGRK